jgi:hypothetical protein
MSEADPTDDMDLGKLPTTTNLPLSEAMNARLSQQAKDFASSVESGYITQNLAQQVIDLARTLATSFGLKL